jgi:hypothetical protein
MKNLLPALILVWLGGFLFGGSVFGGFEKTKQPTCQSEFDQQVKSTSIEHGQDIPHKGKRPNRIVIECEGK